MVIHVYAVILIVNMFFGFYFSFDRTTGDYIHGPLYYVLYLAPGAFTLYAIFLIFYNRKRFTLKQWLPVFSFLLFSVVGLILQGTLIPNMYITFGLVTISFLMILFSLETPDYRRNQKKKQRRQTGSRGIFLRICPMRSGRP